MSRKYEQYRPSFTLAELKEVVSALPQNSALRNKLALYIAKINFGIKAPAYITEGKQTVEESLGFTPPVKDTGAKSYMERLQAKASLSQDILSPEERFNLLAGKAAEGKVLTPEEIEEGKRLEQELYGMDMGTFA